MTDTGAMARGDGSQATGTDTAVHPIVDAAFQALDVAQVRWALVRGADDLARPSGDVDLLIDPRALPDLDRALAGAGFRRMGSRGHGSHRFYFAYAVADGFWLKLDVVSRIEFGRYQQVPTPLAESCLDRRRLAGGIWRLAHADEAWLYLLHLLLDKGGVAPERRGTARRYASSAALDTPVAEFVDRRTAPGTAADIVAAIAADQPVPARRLGRRVAGGPAGSRPGAARAKALGRRVGRRVGRLLELPVAGHPPGLTVALVGADRERTRTLAAAIRQRFPLPAHVIADPARWWSGPAIELHRRRRHLVIVTSDSRGAWETGVEAAGAVGADLVLLLDGPHPATPGGGTVVPGAVAPPGGRLVVLDESRSVDELASAALAALWAAELTPQPS